MSRFLRHRHWGATLLLITANACRPIAATDCNPYACATSAQRAAFKLVRLPLPSATVFTVHQGAFGPESHNEPGNEYAWDLDVPYGTEIVAIEGGRVIDIFTPAGGGGCDPRFAATAHNIKVEHADGSVAQYVHIDPAVSVGSRVGIGEPIARTARNGFICQPHLHLSVYRSRRHLYDSPDRETLPLRFEGVTGTLLLPTEDRKRF